MVRIRSLALLLVATAAASSAFAQEVFRFREVTALEDRMRTSGKEFDPNHRNYLGRESTSTNSFRPDPSDINVYRSLRWLGLLAETDAFRRRGAFALAEKQYLELLQKLRQALGASSPSVGWMLEHLGEFYLEARDFAKAYQRLSEAIAIMRPSIDALQASPQDGEVRQALRAHLAKSLVVLGRLDAARGDMVHAGQKLTEAVAIGNQLARIDDGLDALYFLSQVLEKQGKWEEAQAVWQEAERIRQKMTSSRPYWDIVLETAAFQARRGDFHTAAAIVKRIQSETHGKTLKPVVSILSPIVSIDNPIVVNRDREWIYTQESEVVMAEILAMDRWLTDGPDAAAALVRGALVIDNTFLNRGSDSERGRLLRWLERRAFLNMSILLDGKPSRERIERAYKAIGNIKGRYVSWIADLRRNIESDRRNPGVQTDQIQLLDALAGTRALRAHLYVATALDGKPFDGPEFATIEQEERATLEHLATEPQGNRWHVEEMGDAARLADDVPADSAFVELVLWDRTERDRPSTSRREYSAFVVRNGQPLKYVDLGSADDIDRDVAALNAAFVKGPARGVHLERGRVAPEDDLDQRLMRLYQKVIAPLESSLGDARRLFIAPDGALALTPIAAFLEAPGKYLLQRRSVSYLGSWRDLIPAHVEPGTKITPPVIVANPDFGLRLGSSSPKQPESGRPRFDALPGAELEARDVQQALQVPGNRILVGKAAREDTIRSLEGPEILHFATHSAPNIGPGAAPEVDLFELPGSGATEDPLLRSVIALAGAGRPQIGPEDGLLTGLEVASLHLSGTRLAVLSTCEGGQGTPFEGQGVLGLRAAFSMAGAQGVVMSLWPVDDEAGRRFMQFFYSHLHMKVDAVEAVRQAQIDLMTRTPFTQPRYWAGYLYSADSLPAGGRAPAAASSPAAPPAAPPAGNDETLVNPICVEFHTHSGEPSLTTLQTIRVRIGGGVERSQISPERVTYPLRPPGGEFEQEWRYRTYQGPPTAPEIRVASQIRWLASLSIERRKDQSALYVEVSAEGHPVFMTVALKGGPDLFPSFDIPSSLPPLSAYREATFSEGNSEKIDAIDLCGSH